MTLLYLNVLSAARDLAKNKSFYRSFAKINKQKQDFAGFPSENTVIALKTPEPLDRPPSRFHTRPVVVCPVKWSKSYSTLAR